MVSGLMEGVLLLMGLVFFTSLFILRSVVFRAILNSRAHHWSSCNRNHAFPSLSWFRPRAITAVEMSKKLTMSTARSRTLASSLPITMDGPQCRRLG